MSTGHGEEPQRAINWALKYKRNAVRLRTVPYGLRYAEYRRHATRGVVLIVLSDGTHAVFVLVCELRLACYCFNRTVSPTCSTAAIFASFFANVARSWVLSSAAPALPPGAWQAAIVPLRSRLSDSCWPVAARSCALIDFFQLKAAAASALQGAPSPGSATLAARC